MNNAIISTQNEAIGARPPSLAVAAPMALFWVRTVPTHALILREAYCSTYCNDSIKFHYLLLWYTLKQKQLFTSN